MSVPVIFKSIPVIRFTPVSECTVSEVWEAETGAKEIPLCKFENKIRQKLSS